MSVSAVTAPQQQPAQSTLPPRASIATDAGFVPESAVAAAVAALFSEATRRHQGGQRAEAILLYKRILSLDPDLPEVYSNLGAALAELDRLHEAEAALRRAILLKPDYAEPHANLGMALKNLGRLDEAVTVLQRALALQPGWSQVRSKLGLALYELDRLAEAQAQLSQAVTHNPNLPEARAYLAMTLKGLGRLAEAEVAFREAIALKPEAAELHLNLGTVLMSLGRPDDAVAAYRQALALKPDFFHADNNLGMALRAQGRFDEAEATLHQALALRPNSHKAHNNLGNVLLDLGRHDEAVALYRKAIALKPSFSEAYNNIGLALKELGRLPEALRATEQAIALAPRKAAYFFNLADLKRFVAGEPELSAMEELAKDASLPVQDRIELHFARAKAYEDLGQHENSFRQLLAGNALKRGQIEYDETTILDGLKRVEAVFTPELIQNRRSVGERSRVPVFIMGMLRSGTTLVEQILASHPKVLGAGELKEFAEAVASIRPSQGPAAEFPDVVSGMSSEQFGEFGARYVAELRRLDPKAARIVNKLPWNYVLAGLIHLALPNATIIHTVRDPVDTCLSCFSKLFAEEQNHTYDLAELGRYCRAYQALMAHWHRVLPPGRILDVRYQDIVDDLEGTARRIVAHCGLEWDARCLAFHQTERPVRTASATQVRRPIYRSSLGRWRPYQAFLAPLLAELSAG